MLYILMILSVSLFRTCHNVCNYINGYVHACTVNWVVNLIKVGSTFNYNIPSIMKYVVRTKRYVRDINSENNLQTVIKVQTIHLMYHKTMYILQRIYFNL